jgi:hypothetical protein
MPKKITPKRVLWLLLAAAVLLVVGGGAGLASLWFRHERMSLHFDWDLDRPVQDNLANSLHFDWGGAFSITEHPNADQNGYVGITYRQWLVGPFMWRRVIYQRPGSDYR